MNNKEQLDNIYENLIGLGFIPNQANLVVHLLSEKLGEQKDDIVALLNYLRAYANIQEGSVVSNRISGIAKKYKF